jgi:2-(1,2-epoxy-1,2-dihydrophenyl)acetyl-CoA isomerase
MNMKNPVIVDKLEEVCVIRLNLLESMNSLEKDLRDNLKRSLNEFNCNKECHVAVLTGSGKAFSAGGSFKEIGGGMSAMECVDYIRDVNEIILSITGIEKPIIACVNGVAAGAGFSMALACDIVIASENALFSLAFAKVGLVPDMGGLYFFPRVAGMHKAKELFYTAKMLNANEAQEMGFLNKVVPHEELESYTIGFARQIAQGPMKAFGIAKKLMLKSMELNLGDLLEYEVMAQALCLQSDDHKEGVRAFYDKRKPLFQGK